MELKTPESPYSSDINEYFKKKVQNIQKKYFSLENGNTVLWKRSVLTTLLPGNSFLQDRIFSERKKLTPVSGQDTQQVCETPRCYLVFALNQAIIKLDYGLPTCQMKAHAVGYPKMDLSQNFQLEAFWFF